MFSVKYGRDWKRPTATTHHPALAKIIRLLFHEKHSPGTDEKERSKKVENEIEALHQRNTEPDHDAAHDQRADDAPDESPMLRHRRHLEVLEDEHEDENVIDAERIFDDVAGEKLEPFFPSADFPNKQVEQKREGDPNQRAVSRCAHAQFAAAVFELNKVENQRNKDTGIERQPEPNACVRHRA